MLELLLSGLLKVWLDTAGVKVQPLEILEYLTWQSNLGRVAFTDPNPVAKNIVKQYLQSLVNRKLIDKSLIRNQGIWIQSGPMLMANNEGKTPMPAASLTKIATSLVAFETFGPDYQFETFISTTGRIKNGILIGDLIVQGSGDPLFVWEEAIAIGNSLNRMGIKKVKGNLNIVGDFTMNFQRNPILAGQLFKKALNSSNWNRNIFLQYSSMIKGTLKPKVDITGEVKAQSQVEPGTNILIRHQSLPMKRLITEMNTFSNNDMAHMLAEAVGGIDILSTKAAELAKVPISEILLINGSGLGLENRISPRATCAILMALQKQALTHNLNLADLFPIAGVDKRGTILFTKNLPKATVVKTGTLNTVSALAGVLPTRDRGLVWFAIINRGSQIAAFRSKQGKLLTSLIKQLNFPQKVPYAITRHEKTNSELKFGAKNRNQIIYEG
ncbi:D-alanyl-D-alanine carboxypeptidase [Richelia intracellularis HM01]|uniref:D-alanyl-D-alanine carboxypeptidase n=1 Tax=Richelia intracellularis TaxID=1164990 RepID=UPI0002B4FA8D|nr:D-alanyl-D-alanine carboxypeptidase [Richelia intracellularis]CCH64883.1 D-alanyl-D-alanine carboxypeptidase [Richelia intracellularis HM01]